MKRLAVVTIAACGGSAAPQHPAGAGPVVIDRFSAAASHLMLRDHDVRLPAPGAPIDLDKPPFVTRGLGPDGRKVRYYNFDVQSATPMLRYRVVKPGTHDPIPGQDDVIGAIPGEAGYSDFQRLAWVEAPPGFVAGSITSVDQLRGLTPQLAQVAFDCPVVPDGTTSREPHGPRFVHLRYRGHAVTCADFPGDLLLDGDQVPTSPIYVTFGSEGFRTEGDTPQTHNVVFSLPGDTDYSPLWQVHVYKDTAFDAVHDASSAADAPMLKDGPAVNCPIVFVEQR